jgi:predicted  nucleic acid-binding Zn-ribbon protein
MAKKELTIEEKLRHLWDLQSIDSKKNEILILKGELPMEVQDLEDEIAGLNKRIEKIQDALDEINGEISKHNSNIKESELLIAKYEKQLDNVKNNREYDALTKELEMQKLEIQLSNKRIRDASFGKETKEETIAIAKDKLQKIQEDLDQKKDELSKIIEKTEKEEAKLEKQALKAREGIEERLLKAYDKIRNTYRNGLAVASISRGACGGCFNRIPPQVQIDIGVMKKIIACEHCGRVLVDSTITGESED